MLYLGLKSSEPYILDPVMHNGDAYDHSSGGCSIFVELIFSLPMVRVG